MTATAPETPVPAGFDFSDPDLMAERVPLAEFALLRRTGRPWWNAQPRGRTGFDDDGFWVISKHAHVKEISRDHELFSSNANGAIIRFNESLGTEELDVQRENLLLHMDPPQHTKLRQIVARGFTPRVIGRLHDALQERAERIVAEARRRGGEGDFVTEIAAELPLQAIAELMGVPQEDRRRLFDWSNQMLGYDDPDYDADPACAAAEIIGYAMELADRRRGCPAHDIVTKLVQADVDGRGLTDDEFGYFTILLAVAGNETTRNAISHGMIAFMDNREQWELFKAERPESAVDEIVRWATPVTAFQRTATRDTELGGAEIKAGDRLAMYYSSANFDEEVFEDPASFDITRSPNPHLGFGGTGAHYCIGANLARLEIRLMFDAIADQMPHIARLGEPRRLRSPWLNGIKELPVRYA
ncbi:cytochrome P450 [Actinomadura livida]|uniref:Cholest-4-en-3-one 26-monooxygenase n=1 Tax=Actinomadura livida TaxID=79909 RepID=A0A7W7IH96_9ACTN|nr:MULTISPECIES: cytochrome P450 [Actinomadura]MBB4777092.1 cholest-4-en-3-one 26-monooxygenase [Actinomadura catellatispora]GGU21770.1 cytochrome P450 [Actinomadura livida]